MKDLVSKFIAERRVVALRAPLAGRVLSEHHDAERKVEVDLHRHGRGRAPLRAARVRDDEARRDALRGHVPDGGGGLGRVRADRGGIAGALHGREHAAVYQL